MPDNNISQLVGERITVNSRNVQVIKQLGEGGFSFVYLVKEEPSASSSSAGDGGSASQQQSLSASAEMVLKITSIHSRQQRDIAEKEAKLLARLSHPSIVRMYDTAYRSSPVSTAPPPRGAMHDGGNQASRPQHLILMEYCEGGTALSVCNALKKSGQRFDLPSLIIAFGQICNAVSYLHAQKPAIVHRDLKPVNFLVKNGAYKLCDFGSATFGHVDLRTPSARSEAEEVIEKTTTQMFRAPEMVDLFMAKKLTQATDVWALGCCLYSMAFFSNCFEEGSNLAILSRKYKIPDDNPYGEGLVELIDRMLTMDAKARADMTEVILCLSAIYSGRPLPPRKRQPKKKEKSGSGTDGSTAPKVGAYRTDGQGINRKSETAEPKKPAEAKKLDPNSAAARRKRAVKQQSTGSSDGNKNKKFEASFSDFLNTNSAAATDAFGQPVGSKADGVDFPAFGDVPASGGTSAGGAFDDAFDTNRALFDSKPAPNGKGDLSSNFAKQASLKDRRDDGKKGSRSKAPFKR
mmetsp:Transcript_6476/g.18076  ORF Transcript_6476/g.18076 Transcript_6476/m.18076 type:complete len:519 (-) Transcript_6476:298-1854(-)